MTDENEQQELAETQRDESLKDLDISSDEADQVKGGRANADPCDGGE